MAVPPSESYNVNDVVDDVAGVEFVLLHEPKNSVAVNSEAPIKINVAFFIIVLFKMVNV
jgi:hypothetical protein